MIKKTLLILSLSVFSYSAIFNMETPNNPDVKTKEEVKEETKITIEVKYFEPKYFQNYIDELIKENNQTILKRYSEQLIRNQNIKVNDKQLILNYLFESYIEKFLKNDNINYKIRDDIIIFLSEIVSKIDVTTKEGNLNQIIFKLIEGKDPSIRKYFDAYIKKFFNSYMADEKFYDYYFKVLNSKLINKENHRLGVYFVKAFSEFLETTENYSEELTLEYIKYQYSVNKLFKIKEFCEKILEYNQYNSDAYFYLGQVYKEKRGELFEENLKKSIKYNILNDKSYNSLIQFYIDNKMKYKEIIKLGEYFEKNVKNSYFESSIREKVGLAYYLLGLKETNYDYLLKSYKIYKEFGNLEMLNQIKQYMQQFFPDKYQEEFGN